jgi:Limiting CO2-inducible proteins B/C beta carbonyic anhydrases
LNKLAKVFPNASTNAELITKVSRALDRYGYNEKTLVGFSLCSDEVNRPLEDIFNGFYGEHFNMGGLAGFPFAGVTGFGAMASHIPDGGSCLLVYGPHVGIDSDGNVGKVDRKGKSKSGSCCGSAVAASKYVIAVYKGDAEEVGPPTDSVDAQQNYVAGALLSYGERIATAPDPMAELPFATFEPIDSMMGRIVKKVGGKVGGNVALLGGIQINTPRGVSDYFLPLRFDIRDGKTGEIIEDLMWKRKVGTESRKRITA